MNQYVAAAVAAMDKVPLSRLEHPGEELAMDPAACRFVAAFTRALDAKRVLEFGSGFSTLMLARELAGAEDNYLLSIDDSRRFSEQAREAVETSECKAKVEFRVASLRPRFYGPRLLLSYSLPKGLLEAMGPFDLVLIDTPHHETGREAIFYDAFNALMPGGYLVMDDGNLECTEKVCLRNWLSAFGDSIEPIRLDGIGQGLTVIEKLDDVRPRYPVRGALGASLRTLAGLARLLLRPEK